MGEHRARYAALEGQYADMRTRNIVIMQVYYQLMTGAMETGVKRFPDPPELAGLRRVSPLVKGAHRGSAGGAEASELIGGG